MEGFLYPNEIEVQWSLLIVLYPYITGLVAGAFIVSALCHVFNRRQLEPVAKMALITALSFLFVATMPLLLHLGQPLRAFNIMWTPNPTSAMAGFGYIYSFYLTLVLVEVWFVYRKHFVLKSQTSKGPVKWLFSLLTLGAVDLSPYSLHSDERMTKILASIGIPAAALLHGYVGFIFGAIKANPWWSSALMPIIFLMSAIVSGMGLLILLYSVTSWFRRQQIDLKCMMSLNRYLWYFLLIDVSLELLEVLHKLYETRDEWPAIAHLLTQQIPGSFFGVQLLMGAMLPIILLTFGRSSKLPVALKHGLTQVSALFIVIGVFAMRWNVVIGGQMVSKSLQGFTGYYPGFLGMEGVLPAIIILVLPFIIFAVISYIAPPWPQVQAQAEPSRKRAIAS